MQLQPNQKNHDKSSLRFFLSFFGSLECDLYKENCVLPCKILSLKIIYQKNVHFNGIKINLIFMLLSLHSRSIKNSAALLQMPQFCQPPLVLQALASIIWRPWRALSISFMGFRCRPRTSHGINWNVQITTLKLPLKNTGQDSKVVAEPRFTKRLHVVQVKSPIFSICMVWFIMLRLHLTKKNLSIFPTLKFSLDFRFFC